MAEGADRGHVRLRVLREFSVCVHGRSTRLSSGARRLLALLAVVGQPVERGAVAARLWPDLPDGRASATLRTTLWQVRRAAPGAVAAHGPTLALTTVASVDLHASTEAARRLRGGEQPPADAAQAFGQDLLPDWTDEWVVPERERYRQVRLHALESAVHHLTRAGRHAEAIEAGLCAVAADPLRETAQRAVIQAHLAEGNASEAIRQYRSYALRLHDELGIRPSDDLRNLITAPPAAGGRGGHGRAPGTAGAHVPVAGRRPATVAR